MDPKANEFSPRAISAAPWTSQGSAPPNLHLSSEQATASTPRPFQAGLGLHHSFVHSEPIQHPVFYEQANRTDQSAIQSLPQPAPAPGEWFGQSSRVGLAQVSQPRSDSAFGVNVLNQQVSQPQRRPSTRARANAVSNTATNESTIPGRATIPLHSRDEGSTSTMCGQRLLNGKCDGSDGCPPLNKADRDRVTGDIAENSGEFIGPLNGNHISNCSTLIGIKEAHEEQDSEQDDNSTIRCYEATAVRFYEAGCPALVNFDTAAQGPLAVGPHANSSPYELRALIYSIVWKSNKLHEEANFPLTNLLSQARSPSKRGMPENEHYSVDDGLKELIQIIDECSNQMDTYHSVIVVQQPRLLEFGRILRRASDDIKRATEQFQKLDVIQRTSEDIQMAIRRHRISESLNRVLRGEEFWIPSTDNLGQ